MGTTIKTQDKYKEKAFRLLFWQREELMHVYIYVFGGGEWEGVHKKEFFICQAQV